MKSFIQKLLQLQFGKVIAVIIFFLIFFLIIGLLLQDNKRDVSDGQVNAYPISDESKIVEVGDEKFVVSDEVTPETQDGMEAYLQYQLGEEDLIVTPSGEALRMWVKKNKLDALSDPDIEYKMYGD